MQDNLPAKMNEARYRYSKTVDLSIAGSFNFSSKIELSLEF